MLRELTIRVGWISTIRFWWFLYPWHRLFMCPFGRHKQLVMHITDGRTTVMDCTFCDAEREPTQEEIDAHPNLRYTPEQLAERDARIEKAMQWLRDNGHIPKDE